METYIGKEQALDNLWQVCGRMRQPKTKIDDSMKKIVIAILQSIDGLQYEYADECISQARMILLKSKDKMKINLFAIGAGLNKQRVKIGNTNANNEILIKTQIRKRKSKRS